MKILPNRDKRLYSLRLAAPFSRLFFHMDLIEKFHACKILLLPHKSCALQEKTCQLSRRSPFSSTEKFSEWILRTASATSRERNWGNHCQSVTTNSPRLILKDCESKSKSLNPTIAWESDAFRHVKLSKRFQKSSEFQKHGINGLTVYVERLYFCICTYTIK